jgi:hypothetical protein
MLLPPLLKCLCRREVGAFLLLGCCLACCGCDSPKVDSEHVKKVKKGMTVPQVERILGPGKGGRYPLDDKQWDEVWLKRQGIPDNASWKHWPDPAQTQTQKDIVYNIAFVDGKVVDVITHSVQK